jgi:hypothetical protein
MKVSPPPMRLAQRARLWAITFHASQAALTPKRPESKWFSPPPYLRLRMVFLDLGVTAVIYFELQGHPGPGR